MILLSSQCIGVTETQSRFRLDQEMPSSLTVSFERGVGPSTMSSPSLSSPDLAGNIGQLTFGTFNSRL